MADNPHSGHRDRLRQRFLNEGGFDNFEEHQILELLLFYAIPRRDTNELAHKMIKEFGDLDTLLNAEPEAISTRTNVSINTAVLVSMTGRLINRRCCSKIKHLKDAEQAKEYFIQLLKGSAVEKFYIVCLDKNRRIIKNIKVAEGAMSAVALRLEPVVSDIVRYGASYAVCGHNHPAGTMDFSLDDNQTTVMIKQMLSVRGIRLMDHILVCGNEAVSMSDLKKFKF